MLFKRSARLKLLRDILNGDSMATTITLSTSTPSPPRIFQMYDDSLSGEASQNVFALLSSHTADTSNAEYPTLKNKINPKPFISTTQSQVPFLTDYKTIMCFGYSDDWGRDPFTQIGVAPGTNGYLFLTVPSVSDWNDKVYSKVNRPYNNISGSAQITIITHASQVNSLNNPDAVAYGPISQFVLDNQGRYPFTYLIYDEYIYNVNVSESPLSFISVVNYTGVQNSRVNIFDIIKYGLQTSTVPVSEFESIWSDATSSDNSIAEVDFGIKWIPPFLTIKESKDTILLKQSGTFVLKITQRFYQSSQYKIGYKRKVFDININLNTYKI